MARTAPSLTVRERDVLGCLALGQTDGEIAETIGASVGTVRKHRQHLLEKTHTHNGAELVYTALVCRWMKLEGTR